MKDSKKQYYAVKNSDTACCPTCNHILDQNKGIALLNLKNIAMGHYDKSIELTAQINELKQKLKMEKSSFYALDENANVNNTEKIKITQQNIKDLENKKAEIDKFNNTIDVKAKNIAAAKKDISNFSKAQNTNNKLIDNLKETKKVAQKLYITYIEQKMLLAKEYLKDVNIKFYSVLKGTRRDKRRLYHHISKQASL